MSALAEVEVGSGAWHGEERTRLGFPARWSVTTHRPPTPAPLRPGDLREALAHPVGQPSIAELAAGARRPVVVVDDPTRPTPVAEVLPLVLAQLGEAGVSPEEVCVVVGTGTHGPPTPDSLQAKLGKEAASRCRVVVHDDRGPLARVGRTSFGTPIRVNAQVAAADLLVGIGGVYPQHTTGFGGGSKLILGVLGRETIARLHYGHPSGQGSYRVDNDFRADLDEIAARLGFRTAVSVHVDERRRIVRAVSGDHLAYYPEAVRYAMDTFAAPLPGDADVVVSNAYPMDTSLTFMRSKGMTPFDHAKPGASRLVVAGCAEGVGHHGLFPYRNRAPGPALKHHARRLRAHPSRAPAMVRSAMARAVRAGRGSPAGPSEDPSPPPLLYATAGAPALPQGVTRLVPHDDWHAVLDTISAQQSGRDGLTVALYTCAPLQVLLP